MLRYQEFSICAPHKELIGVLKHWKECSNEVWRFDKNRTKDLAMSLNLSIDSCAYVYCSPNLYSAEMWFVINDDKLILSNIISQRYFELGKERYNRVVEAFYETFAQKYTDPSVPIFLSSAHQEFAELVNEETAKAFVKWEKLCNKGDGGTNHPFDRERWFEALYTAYATDSSIDLDILEQWLVDDCGWNYSECDDDEDRLQKLLLKFEYGRDLIEFVCKKHL